MSQSVSGVPTNAQPTTPSSPSILGATTSKPTIKKEGLKICCACPETKKRRDECIIENGESACEKLIEAHKVCLRAAGFDI
jgi:cytochrome c oxidase assembly protein subunit 17